MSNFACNLSLSLPSATPPQKTKVRKGFASDTAFLTPTHRLGFACGICAEERITLTCTRRNDLRRHIENFHNSNALWVCQHPGCKVAYEWPAAYQSHIRNDHGRSQMNMSQTVVKLCPQMVFACGFENCSHIFEAVSEDDTSSTFKEYSWHIIKHFEEGPNGGCWTYSTRIHNLLRQSQVEPAWEKSCTETERARLRWDSQSSLALRKLLEARHLDNLPLLIEFSILLGSNPTVASGIAGVFEPPVKAECPYEHKASPSAGRLSLQVDGEQETYQFNQSRGISLDYWFTGTIQLRAHVPRSIEPFIELEPADYGRGRYNDLDTMRLLTPYNYYN